MAVSDEVHCECGHVWYVHEAGVDPMRSAPNLGKCVRCDCAKFIAEEE